MNRIPSMIDIFASNARLSATHGVVCLPISSTTLDKLIEVSYIECGPSHFDVRHILELGAYFFHTLSPIIVKHRESDVTIKLWFLGLTWMKILSSSYLTSRPLITIRIQSIMCYLPVLLTC